jgi:Cft2 family RNA processing exonuclease
VEESKALNERKDPMIIISAAGMAENGRIRHHLKYNIENPLNTILIVSWQAPETLGRRIADRDKRVHILGDTYTVKAEVATIGGLSAHGGQDFLIEYAQATQATLNRALPGARRAEGGGGFQDEAGGWASTRWITRRCIRPLRSRMTSQERMERVGDL